MRCLFGRHHGKEGWSCRYGHAVFCLHCRVFPDTLRYHVLPYPSHTFLRRGRRYRTEMPAHEPPLAERLPVPAPRPYDHRRRWSAVGGGVASGRCSRPRIHSRGLGSVQPEERQAEWGSGARCREQDRPGCGWAAPAATPTPVPCLQHSVTLVPAETFSSEFVEPRVRCISSHGAFSPSR